MTTFAPSLPSSKPINLATLQFLHLRFKDNYRTGDKNIVKRQRTREFVVRLSPRKAPLKFLIYSEH